jgi:hypothetical protein
MQASQELRRQHRSADAADLPGLVQQWLRWDLWTLALLGLNAFRQMQTCLLCPSAVRGSHPAKHSCVQLPGLRPVCSTYVCHTCWHHVLQRALQSHLQDIFASHSSKLHPCMPGPCLSCCHSPQLYSLCRQTAKQQPRAWLCSRTSVRAAGCAVPPAVPARQRSSRTPCPGLPASTGQHPHAVIAARSTGSARCFWRQQQQGLDCHELKSRGASDASHHQQQPGHQQQQQWATTASSQQQ